MQNKSIFGDQSANTEAKKEEKNYFAEQIEKRNLAANERQKGNEFMKSKEYDLAVASYSRSIELDPNESFTLSNRAQAYISLKQFSNAIEDCN